MKASVSNAWDETKAVIGSSNAPIVAVALAFLMLPMAVLGTYSPETLMGMAPSDPTVSLLMLVFLLVGLVGRLAIARIAIGPQATVSEALQHSLRRTLPTAAAFIVFMLPVALIAAPFLLQIMQNPASPPPGPSLAFLAIVLVAVAFGVRALGLVIPAAAAESGGPIALLRRSWALTAGSWLRLLGFVCLIYLASWITGWAAGAVLGTILATTAGTIQSMSVTALILAAVLAVIAAIFSVLLIVMLARIYAQLARGTDAGAANSGN